MCSCIVKIHELAGLVFIIQCDNCVSLKALVLVLAAIELIFLPICAVFWI